MLSELHERIIDVFLKRCEGRADVKADVLRRTIVELYPMLEARLEIVEVEGRKIVVKRPHA